jgi:hypothetical protein
VAEWFKAPVLKTGVPARVPWVRIPPLPPELSEIIDAFGFYGLYAQSGAQNIWDDTDSIGLVVFALTLAIFLPTPSSHGAGSARWGEPAAATYDGPVTMLA